MSDNPTSTECLVHYNNQHIQVRRDFFDLCSYDKNDFNQGLTKNGKKVKDEPNQECMAKIIRLLETLTNRKKEAWYLETLQLKARGITPPKESEEYLIELSYSTIVILLYNTYGESIVRNSIAVLLHRGYIKRYQETKGSVPSYAISIPVLQAALDKQRKETPQSRVSKSTAGVSKSTPKAVEIDRVGVSKSTPNNIEDKITNKILNERKNGTSSQTSNVTDGKASHSSTHSSSSYSQFSSSQETKPEEVSLSEEEQHVYDLACQRFFVSQPPEVTPTVKEHCAKIAKAGIQTLEQMKQLEGIARQEQRLGNKQIYLGNLARGLNGWLQMQNAIKTPKGVTLSSYDDDDYVDDTFYPVREVKHATR
jgi:hypothetical protein